MVTSRKTEFMIRNSLNRASFSGNPPRLDARKWRCGTLDVTGTIVVYDDMLTANEMQVTVTFHYVRHSRGSVKFTQLWMDDDRLPDHGMRKDDMLIINTDHQFWPLIQMAMDKLRRIRPYMYVNY